MSVISKTPLTTLRDISTGGAPVYIGGDRLASETVPTAPEFDDDDDEYFYANPMRRALFTIAHIPGAGSSSIDFITMNLRNSHVTQRAYVNVLFAADVSVQLRVDGLATASPVYGDVMLIETDGTLTAATVEIDAGTSAIRVTVTSSDTYDVAPSVVFSPAPSGLLSAITTLGEDGRIDTITVYEATSHSYSSPPTVAFAGGKYRTLGFFVDEDDDTLVYEHNTAGTLTVVSTLARTQYASNISAPGDVVIIGNEARVVRSVANDHTEFVIDRALVSTTTSFETWSYIPIATASHDSLLRTGAGVLAVNAVYGSNAGVTTQPHNLAVGDVVFYSTSADGLHHSHRVDTVVDATTFLTDGSLALASGETAEWRYIYRLSQENPNVSTATVSSVTRVINIVRMMHDESTGEVVDILGLAGRKLWVRNLNYFSSQGSHYDADVDPTGAVVQYGVLAPYHATHRESPNVIDPAHVIEVVVPPQPAPATVALSGAALSGGLAGSVGKRPIVAVYQRGVNVRSSTVTMWGDYQRYTSNTITSYTQSINV